MATQPQTSIEAFCTSCGKFQKVVRNNSLSGTCKICGNRVVLPRQELKKKPVKAAVKSLSEIVQKHKDVMAVGRTIGKSTTRKRLKNHIGKV